MNFKDFFGSQKVSHALAVLGALIVALLIFQAGIFVGYHKARFSYRMGDNFHRTFGERNRFSSGRGVVGKIIKIDLPALTIEDRDNVEKTVVIGDDTAIRRFRESIKPENLKADDYVIVIGSPDDSGEIKARLIRIVPPPPQS